MGPMRMMTGAIMILAGSFLLGICELKDDPQVWMVVYSYVLAGVGIGFLLWGFLHDIAVYSRRRSRQKGDDS